MDKKLTTPDVNLLPEDDLESRPGGKFLKWALSWGKKIVVLTELLVVLAFLSRFKLDSDVANFSEEIDRRRTIIIPSSDFEKQFLFIQDRIKKAKIITTSPSLVTVYDKMTALIPSGIIISTTSLTPTTLSVQGKGEDSLLTTMVTAFKGSSDFDEVTLETVSKSSADPLVKFTLTATYIPKNS